MSELGWYAKKEIVYLKKQKARLRKEINRAMQGEKSQSPVVQTIASLKK